MARPKIENAPGLVWRQRGWGNWEARWQTRSDIAARGYSVKGVRLWGPSQGEPSPTEVAYIQDQCRRLQDEMLIWSRGGMPVHEQTFKGTLGDLIWAYQNDKDSNFHKLRIRTRQNHNSLMVRMRNEYGDVRLEDIKARLLKAWHEKWAEGGKVAMAREFMGQLRTLCTFGFTMLEDECGRLRSVLGAMRFQMAKPRKERMTADQAVAIRAAAHACGLHSIALAQALQFDLMLRQKDVIGEWVPMGEPGTSDVIDAELGNKWLWGLRWSEIDENLILRHTTSKRDKELEVDLRLAPMVMEELGRLGTLPRTGPVIVAEGPEQPWCTVEFRRYWRKVADYAGMPQSLKNMDSRAGGITEATDAGAALDRHDAAIQPGQRGKDGRRDAAAGRAP